MKCTPCMSESLKNLIRDFTDDPSTLRQVNAIPTCSLGEILQLCDSKTGGRKRSAYQEFTSQCLKDKHLTKFDPNALKDCARQWTEAKKKGVAP